MQGVPLSSEKADVILAGEGARLKRNLCDKDNLVPWRAIMNINVLKNEGWADDHDLYPQFLAKLTDQGVGPALAELDAAAQRADPLESAGRITDFRREQAAIAPVEADRLNPDVARRAPIAW